MFNPNDDDFYLWFQTNGILFAIECYLDLILTPNKTLILWLFEYTGLERFDFELAYINNFVFSLLLMALNATTIIF